MEGTRFDCLIMLLVDDDCVSAVNLILLPPLLLLTFCCDTFSFSLVPVATDADVIGAVTYLILFVVAPPFRLDVFGRDVGVL